MSDERDEYGLDRPFGERYYDKSRPGTNPDDVTVAMYAAKTLREAGFVAMSRFRVPEQVVKSILEQTTRPAIRMMNLSRACHRYGCVRTKKGRTSKKIGGTPFFPKSLTEILTDES